METFRIIPIKTGEFTGLEKSSFTYLTDAGRKIVVPMIMFLLEGRNRVVLVDTGGSDEEWARKHHHPVRRAEGEEPVAALRRHGVDVADVDTIVHSHLHWDHCFNDRLFPNARFFVQRRELRYAVNPLPAHHVYYESEQVGLRPRWLDVASRIVETDGDTALCDGIDLLLLPGHTPGLQGVLVETETGKYLLPSDTTPLFENWHGNPAHRHIPCGIHVDLTDCYASLARMEATGATILASHDPLVLSQESYP